MIFLSVSFLPFSPSLFYSQLVSTGFNSRGEIAKVIRSNRVPPPPPAPAKRWPRRGGTAGVVVSERTEM